MSYSQCSIDNWPVLEYFGVCVTEQSSSVTLPFVTAKGKRLGIHTEFGILPASTGKKGTWPVLAQQGYVGMALAKEKVTRTIMRT